MKELSPPVPPLVHNQFETVRELFRRYVLRHQFEAVQQQRDLGGNIIPRVLFQNEDKRFSGLHRDPNEHANSSIESSDSSETSSSD